MNAVVPMEWGVKPLPAQERYARLVRELTSQVLSLETGGPVLDDLLATLELARDRLAAEVPAGTHPRIGRRAESDGRVFIDHCRDIGTFNPMFPAYEFALVEESRAAGTVTFPIAYEGPAGCVNGGFLAVFFDEVVQHHNCDRGVSGATRDFDISYRRPTPLLVDLEFEISRNVVGRTVYSEVALRRGEELLCSAKTNAVVVGRETPDVAERRTR